MAKQTVGKTLSKFAINGWPKTIRGFRQIINPLVDEYGIPSISSESYPDLGHGILLEGRGIAYFSEQTGKWETNPDLFKPTGMRWSLRFSNGQTLSVLVSNDGQLIERTYSDKGDIHIEEVIKFIRGWQKSIDQIQSGGAPKGTRPETAERYRHLAEWYDKACRSSRGNMTQKDFCEEAGIKRWELQRAIKYVAENGSKTDN